MARRVRRSHTPAPRESCRFCRETDGEEMLRPCSCSAPVHRTCIDGWRAIASCRTTCEVCRFQYRVAQGPFEYRRAARDLGMVLFSETPIQIVVAMGLVITAIWIMDAGVARITGSTIIAPGAYMAAPVLVGAAVLFACVAEHLYGLGMEAGGDVTDLAALVALRVFVAGLALFGAIVVLFVAPFWACNSMAMYVRAVAHKHRERLVNA